VTLDALAGQWEELRDARRTVGSFAVYHRRIKSAGVFGTTYIASAGTRIGSGLYSLNAACISVAIA